MDTLVLERHDRTFLVSDAHVLKSLEEASELSPRSSPPLVIGTWTRPQPTRI